MRGRVTDTIGNSAIRSATFVLDRTPPAAPMITSAPPSVTGRSAALSFEGEPQASFECRLDSTAYTACTSPTAYADLAEGLHTFDVRAVDVAGNAGPSTKASWTVDATGPTIAITFPLADKRYNQAGYKAGCGTTSTGDICGTASDGPSTVAQVQITVRQTNTGMYYNGSAYVATPTWLTATGTTNWLRAVSSAAFTTDGAYEITARATDAVGNSNTRSVSFISDRIKPTAAALSGTNGGAIVRRLDQGDVLTLTYSEPIDPASLLAGWNGTSQATAVRTTTASGNDNLKIYNSANTTLLPLGTVNMRRSDYITANGRFNATMVLSGSTITITLGTAVNGTYTTAATTGNMDWAPSSTAKDLAGNTASTTARVETDNDSDFWSRSQGLTAIPPGVSE